MTDLAAYELLAHAATLPIRILNEEATEAPEFSSQSLRCKILRDDVADGALPLIFAIAVLSFHEARPRGTSDIDYVERDEWTVDDLCRHLHFTRGTLHLDTDYLRGRMMKTRVMVRAAQDRAVNQGGRTLACGRTPGDLHRRMLREVGRDR